jgi:flavodoxin
MKIIVVYDTVYGCTGEIAKTIADTIGGDHEVHLASVQQARQMDLADCDLLIVGSPTRGFQATPNIAEYLAGLAPVAGQHRAAAFDTRLDLDPVNPLRWLLDAGGYASTRIGSALEARGYSVDGRLAGFAVSDVSGPLKAGEIERARQWSRTLTG